MNIKKSIKRGETMYYCNSCNESFSEPMRRADYDDNPHYLQASTAEEHVCPCCGSYEYEWVENHCSDCGDYLPDSKLHEVDDSELMLCDGCVRTMEQKDKDRQEERDA